MMWPRRKPRRKGKCFWQTCVGSPTPNEKAKSCFPQCQLLKNIWEGSSSRPCDDRSRGAENATWSATAREIPVPKSGWDEGTSEAPPRNQPEARKKTSSGSCQTAVLIRSSCMGSAGSESRGRRDFGSQSRKHTRWAEMVSRQVGRFGGHHSFWSGPRSWLRGGSGGGL